MKKPHILCSNSSVVENTTSTKLTLKNKDSSMMCYLNHKCFFTCMTIAGNIYSIDDVADLKTKPFCHKNNEDFLR